jgi:hypothetical protein
MMVLSGSSLKADWPPMDCLQGIHESFEGLPFQ